MSKHTPGPWRRCGLNLSIGPETYYLLKDKAAIPIAELEANAYLMAAAPDLLERGEKAVRLFESLAKALIAEGLSHIMDSVADEHGGDKHGKNSTIDDLRQTIAKAKP